MSNRNRLSLEPRELLFRLDELVRAMPEGEAIRAPNSTNHDWVGQAIVLIGAWDQSREAKFAQECDGLFLRSAANGHSARVEGINCISRIRNTLSEARGELRLITGGRISESFDAGQPFEIYEALRKVIETAEREILFVDNFMGSDFVSSFLPHVPQGVSVRLLTRDLLDKLTASVDAFVQQKPTRIEIRTSTAVHGRFLCLDQNRAFLIDASFKDAAKRAPVMFMEISDIADSAIAQYEAKWQAGTVHRKPS